MKLCISLCKSKASTIYWNCHL